MYNDCSEVIWFVDISILPSSSYDVRGRLPMTGVVITSMSFSEDEESQSRGVVDDRKTFHTIELLCSA